MNFNKLFLMMSLSLFCGNDLLAAAAAAAAPLYSSVSLSNRRPAMSTNTSLMASVMQKIGMEGGFANMPVVLQNLCFNGSYNCPDYLPGIPTPKLVLDHGGRFVCSAELNKAGDTLLTVCSSHIVRLWSMVDGAVIAGFNGRELGIEAIKFNKTEDALLALCENGIILLNLDGTIRTEFNHASVAHSFESNNAGDKLLAAYEDGFVIMFNSDGTEYARFGHRGKPTYSADFNKDETLLVTSCRDGVVRLWDVNNPRKECVRFDHGIGVASAQFIRNDTALLTRRYDGVVRIWDIEGPLLTEFDHGGKFGGAPQLNEAGDMLLTSCYDRVSHSGGEVRLWNIATKKFMQLDHGNEVIHTAIFNSAEDHILTTADKSVKLWTIGGIESVCLNFTYPLSNYKPLFNRAEDGFFTIHTDGYIKLWDISFLKQLKSLNQEQIAILLALDQAQRNNLGKPIKLEDIIAFYALDESQVRKTVQSFNPTILKHVRDTYNIIDMDRYLVSEEEWIKFVIAGFAPDFLRDI